MCSSPGLSPKVPSLNPGIKRFAVQTEDHPLEYADFEGVIPEGNYGAGAMIVWDRGRFVQLPVTEKEEKDGKLLFELFGHKLKGVWTLFPTNREKREWLLLKKQDAWSRAQDEYEPPPESIFSGLTVQQLASGFSKTSTVRDEISNLDLPLYDPPSEGQTVMLAEHTEQAFTREGWIFELKYDGFRLVATRTEHDPAFHYRSGLEATRLYPDLSRALLSLPSASIVLDGEVVVLDDDGRPNFQRLQRRLNSLEDSIFNVRP